MEIEYIKYTDIIKKLNINEGDIVFISSDIKKLLWNSRTNGEVFDPNKFIDSIILAIGNSGTLLFPTFNWDFCKGIQFNYYETKCKTGVLGQTALKRQDFKRTKHPIYSFAVWGKDKDLLCGLENQSSFGEDSPFAYMHKNKAKNILIDIDYKNCFTFVHYVEEQVGNIHYRYLKNFTADYRDDDNRLYNKTYSMFVRNLDIDVQNTINPIGNVFEQKNVSKKYLINESEFILVDLYEAYPIIEDDIINNRSRNICTYLNQED
jgi:aminoglycoside 3-N-acetyltransferase